MSLFIGSPLESILDRLSRSHGLHNDRTGIKSLHVTNRDGRHGGIQLYLDAVDKQPVEMGDTGEFKSLYLEAVNKLLSELRVCT